MDEKNPLLDSLPGSEKIGGPKTMTNHTLMPAANKPPGASAQKMGDSDFSPDELLGSGRKIPESVHARMSSQFSQPDPAIYDPRRRKEEPVEREEQWISKEVRNTIPYTVYKTATTSKYATGDVGKAIEKLAKEAAMTKARTESEHKRLQGQKESMLHTFCTNPAIGPGSSEVKRMVNIIGEINKKLGLPFNHYGSWKMPQ